MSRKTFSQFLVLAIFLLASLVVPVAVRAGGVCGGTYIVAYGPMIVGGIRFFQGLFGMMG